MLSLSRPPRRPKLDPPWGPHREYAPEATDAWLRVIGHDLPTLFARAGRTLGTFLQRGATDFDGLLVASITLDAPDRRSLMEAWLTELMVRHRRDHWLPTWFLLGDVTDTGLSARVAGPVAVLHEPLIHEVVPGEVRVLGLPGRFVARATLA